MNKEGVIETAAQLRQVADFIEEHADALEGHYIPHYALNIFPGDAQKALALARAIGGKWDKKEAGDWLYLRRAIGRHTIEINMNRNLVCERVQVGTKTVEVPDPEAALVTVEEPVYEWHCPESLNAVAS